MRPFVSILFCLVVIVTITIERGVCGIQCPTGCKPKFSAPPDYLDRNRVLKPEEIPWYHLLDRPPRKRMTQSYDYDSNNGEPLIQ